MFTSMNKNYADVTLKIEIYDLKYSNDGEYRRLWR
jgi:hypothetical protein